VTSTSGQRLRDSSNTLLVLVCSTLHAYAAAASASYRRSLVLRQSLLNGDATLPTACVYNMHLQPDQYEYVQCYYTPAKDQMQWWPPVSEQINSSVVWL
jgi:hypothetical protein